MRKPTRAPRADGARNRELLLAAGEEEFAEHGIDASVADIARRAGVAKATFFRHFATKDDLVTAIVEPHMIALAEVGERLLDERDAGAALLELLTESASRRQQRDVSFLLRPGSAPPQLVALRDRVYDALDRLVKRAQASGVIRKDISTVDVFLLMCAPVHVVEYLPDPDPELFKRYLGIIFDGLRPQGAHPLPQPPPALGA